MIEDRVRAHPLVSQCVVVGDGQPYVAALITLDPEALPAWAKQHGKSGTTPEELADDPDLQAAIQQAIDEGNKAVSKAESVRRFRVLIGRAVRAERAPHAEAVAETADHHEGLRGRGRRPLQLTSHDRRWLR